LALEDKPVAQSTSKSKPLELQAGGPLRSLVHRSPSATEGGNSKTAAAWLDTISAGAADWGTLAHEWLSHIEWLEAENIGPGVEDLTKLAARLGISQQVVPGVQKLLIKALEAPAIRELLSAPMNSDTPEVWCERSFSVLLTEEGKEEIWNGSIDRAVLHLDPQGAWTKATIIDFKTDSVSADDLEGCVKHYAPQLEAYRRVLAALTELDPNNITLQLAFLVPGVVVDC
jgi:ATP-dependent exoDNAse (exonuclease V) beta subunit